jgi:hypothetical protein
MRITVEDAIQIANELAQIRSIYGEDCARFVERALRGTKSGDWRTIISGAVNSWSLRHRRAVLAH